MKQVSTRSTLLSLFCIALFCTAFVSAADPVPLAFGQAVNGTIGVLGEVDTFTFTGTAGDWVLGRAGAKFSEETWSLTTTSRMQLYGPSGTLLGTYDWHYEETGYYVAPEFLLQLPSTGTYSVLVADDDGQNTGDYSVMVQRTNDPGNSATISYGTTAIGSITAPAEFDTYTFAATEGDAIYARLSSQFGPGNSADIRLFAPDGMLLIASNGTSPVELSATASVTGIYTLLLGEMIGSYTGDYRVYAQRCNAPHHSVALGFGQTVNGSLGAMGVMDAFTFTGDAGDWILGRAGAKFSIDTGLTFTPRMQLYDPTGTLIGAYDEHYGETGYWVAPEFLFQLQTAGTYTLLVADNDGQNTGDYSVMIQRTNNPGNAATIAYGTTATGSITAPAEFDTYTLSAQQGDALYARVSAQFSNNNYPDLRLYAPDGTLLISPNGMNPVDLSVDAPTTGTYALLVGETVGSYTGDYGVYLQRLTAPQSSSQLGFGQAINGSLSAIGEMDAYTFTGTAGDWVFGRGASSADPQYPDYYLMFTPRLQVYGPSGILTGRYDWHYVDKGFDVAPEFFFQLPTTGTYTMLVCDDDGQNTGDYGVYVQRINGLGNAATIAYGTTTTGSISSPAEFDTYTFAAQQGDPIYARISSRFDSWNRGDLRLFAPNGTLLAAPNGTNPVELSVTAPTTGTYSLLAGETMGPYTGDYGVYLQRLTVPQLTEQLGFGEVANGSLGAIGEMDAYTFTGTTGDWVFGRADWKDSEYRARSVFTPHMQVYGPSGELLGTYDEEYGNDWEYHPPEFLLQLQTPGTYTVLVADKDGQDTGYYYGIAVQRTNRPEHAVTIDYGINVNGSIDLPVELDTYTFAAAQSDGISVHLSYYDNATNWLFGSSLRLFAPNGTLLVSSDSRNGDRLSITAPVDGTYTIIIADHRGSNTGQYQLKVGNLRPVKMFIGQTYRGTISDDSGIPWNYYFADISAGEDLLVRVTPDSSSAEMEIFCAMDHAPTADSYDRVQREKTVTGAYELLISPTVNGTYYFGVFVAEGSMGYTIRATVEGTYISSVYPSVVPNAPHTRFQVHGLGFVPGMQVHLAQAGTTIFTAESVVLASPTMVVATFDLSSAYLETYDLIVEWPDQTIRTRPSALRISPLGTGMVYQERRFVIASGQTTTIPLDFTGGPNLFVTLQKVENQDGFSGSWSGILNVLRDGVEIATDRGAEDQIVHIPSPPPGNYSVSVIAPERGGTAILTVWSQLPVLTPGEWVVDTVYRGWGSTFRQIELPPGQEQLTFDAEAMGGVSYFTVYHGLWGSDRTWISSMGQEASLTIPNPQAGLYIVEFMDSANVRPPASQVREVLLRASTSASAEPPPNYLPSVSSVSPLRGGNGGPVSLTIKGAWLDPNATVSLDQNGQAAITALSVAGNPERTTLSASFNLTGKAVGSYNVTVTNPDGTALSWPRLFVIEEGGSSDFWIEIVGRDKLRIDKPSTYILRYGNRGTIDMKAPRISIATEPASSSVSIGIPPSTAEYPMSSPVTVKASGDAGRPDILPAGSTFTKEIIVTGASGEDFTLTAVPIGSNPLLLPPGPDGVTDAAAPSPGLQLTFGRVFPAGVTWYWGALGIGWVHSYDMRLKVLPDGEIGLMRGRGISALLSGRGDGTYASEDGSMVLTRNGDGTSVLASNDGSTIRFGTITSGGGERPISFTDRNGNQITLTYSADVSNPKLTGIQHSDGDHFTLEYNDRDRLTRLIDHAGRVTTYEYSGILLTSVTAPDGSVTRYAYDGGGPYNMYTLANITYPGGVARNYRYDGDKRLTESSFNVNRQPIQYTYDEANRTTTVRNAGGMSNSVKVNENGEVVRSTDGLGNSYSYAYDQNNDLVSVTTPLGDAYRVLYDDKHRVIGTVDPLGNRVSFGYDSRFDLVNAITDPRGNAYQFSIDDRRNLVGVTYPDARSQAFAYDAHGNLVGTTTRKGETVVCQYTARGQLSRVDYPDGSFKAFTYDAVGNMLTAADPNGTIAITYDDRNLPTSVTYPDGSSFTYTYDPHGWLTRRTESTGYSTVYTYDDVGNLLQVTDGSGTVIVKYAYGVCGKVIRKELHSGAYTTYGYTPTGKIANQVNHNTNGSVLSRFDYQYDLVGNAIAVDTLEGQYRYGYDALGQVMDVAYPDGSSTHYTYDASGNRVSVTGGGTTTNYAVDAMNRYTTAGAATYAYDATGNMVSRTEGSRTTTYAYDYSNRLTRVTSPEGTEEYLYDALGNRVGVRENGVLTRYVVDPMGMGDVVAEYAENGTLVTRYGHGHGLVSMTDAAGTEYSYHFNPTGHTTEVTDPAGRVVNRYRYTPFGEYRQKVVGVENPFTFVGEFGVMDDSTGLHYMRLRSYAPELGRFTSEDPAGIGTAAMNWYSYCDNNPIAYVDPMGASAKNVVCGGVKAAAGLAGVVAILTGPPLVGVAGAVWAGWMLGNALWDLYRGAEMMAGGQDPGSITERVLSPWGEGGSDVAKASDEIKDFVDLKKNSEKGFKWFAKSDILSIPTLLDKICEPLFDLLKKDELPIDPVMSCDPEDKYGPRGYDAPSTPSSSRQRFITGNDPLEYRVDFWNAENATANVVDVLAFDQLDSDLDLSTFGFSEVGFTNWSVPLEGAPSFDVYVDARPEMPYIVHITGALNHVTGNVTLEYHTLDAVTLQPPDDPVAGFLPPLSTNEYGWFAFSAMPKAASGTGTVIENRAWVNFDYTQYMPAPPDGPWRNTLDKTPPSTSMTASLQGSTGIQVSFSGTDTGSGVKWYTIYASDNGGDYVPVLNHITETTTVITGVPGHTYRFFSIGTDNVGHEETMKSSPDATVSVPMPTPPVTTPIPPLFKVVPGGSSLPRDLNNDAKYEDVNGNARKDFADVVLYFNQMSWIAANEPVTAFDYNGNGRIDFADVVWLFNNL